MNISHAWLRAIAPTIDTSAVDTAARITHTAVPVDDVVWLAEGLVDIVVGRVAEVRDHPNADRLVICAVDVGERDVVQVVTGAPNVVEGALYPFVGAGSMLPGGQRIRSVDLRGERSEGMLCSERELRLGRDQAGILQLRGDYEPGQSLIEALGLDDHRLVLDVTPNRPDLLGHWGVAREAAPGGVDDLRLPEIPGGAELDYSTDTTADEGESGDVVVRVEDPEGCPRYMGLVVRGVTVAPSPDWLAKRLRAIGLQPINNVVDATNYVLYELNQPLHAFDLQKLRGGHVIIRRGRKDEKLRTLDGVERKLNPEILVIADAEGPTALAGIMGGEGSEVDEETRDLFLECAYFDRRRVRHGCRILDLHTDASYRFERGIDPAGSPAALHRVARLILTAAGGEIDGPAADVQHEAPARRSIGLRPSRVAKVLGVSLGEAEVEECLAPIGFEMEDSGEDALTIRSPTWRPDVEREVDLIEEIARRRGYDRFPDELGAFRPGMSSGDPYASVFARVRDVFVQLGFAEALTVPFTTADEGEVRLTNPLSEREDHLRDRLLPGLVHRVEHNFARGHRDVRLFELGAVFRDSGEPKPEERIRVSAVWTGRRSPLHWTENGDDWDIWDLKWIFEEVCALATARSEVRPADIAEGDGRSGFEEPYAAVTSDGEVVGWAGRIRAAEVEAPPWAGEVWGLELEIEPLQRKPTPYRALPTYPAAERDLSLLVPNDHVTAEVGAAIRDAAPQELEELTVFDVYEDASLPQDTRSIGWRLRFRAPDRTLTDEEVDAAVGTIISVLEQRLNVRVRGS